MAASCLLEWSGFLRHTEKELREMVEQSYAVDMCLWTLDFLSGLDYINDLLRQELTAALKSKIDAGSMDFIFTRKSDGKETLIKDVFACDIVKEYNAHYIRARRWTGVSYFLKEKFLCRPANLILTDGAGI